MQSLPKFFLGLFSLAAIAACSVQSSPAQQEDASTQDASHPTTMPSDVGKNCNAGCGVDLCIVTGVSDCAAGDCLLDSRGGLTNMDSYCTGDCTSAACPSGFACESVPDALTGAPLERCMKSGTGNDGGTQADANTNKTCGIPTGDPTCDSCLTANCCSQEQACVNDTDCMALISCLDGCSAQDQTCINGCFDQYPSTVHDDLANCASSSCPTACAG